MADKEEKVALCDESDGKALQAKEMTCVTEDIEDGTLEKKTESISDPGK